MKCKTVVFCILAGIVLGILAGCSGPVALKAGEDNKGYNVICLNGVQYYQGGYSLAPKYSNSTALGFPKNHPDGC